MGGFYNININDCYAAAALGMPVQPGMGMVGCYPPPYLGKFTPVPDHFEKQGHGHHQRHPGFVHKLLLLAGGLTIVGALLALAGKKEKAAKVVGTTAKRWWKPQTWQHRAAVWNPARVHTDSMGWRKVDSFNRSSHVYGRGSRAGVSPTSGAYPRGTGPVPPPRGKWERFKSWVPF